MNNNRPYAIGLDIGGTNITGAIIRNTGEIHEKISIDTNPDTNADEVLERVYMMIEELMDKSKVPIDDVSGIGVATAGVIDSKENVIVFANNLHWRNVQIGRLIGDRFALPIKLTNDANAAAIAEWVWGGGKAYQNMIYITVSTGIGAGIISNGRLITGCDDSAGEFGHITINADGPLCVCGNKGCVERYASGTAIAEKVQNQLKTEPHRKTYFGYENERLITSKIVEEAADQGDELALNAFKEAGYYLGIGITNLINLFNPEVIILGGGVMKAQRFMLPAIQETINERGISALTKRVQLSISSLDQEGGVLGGAGLFFMEQPSLTNNTVDHG
ncbi:ROK family protein [Bacillus sp. Marseille-Q3570]|uniref:ROK family protein n=1 Tax=Bacillus sp. Marseille-Q3570 TaxID=2963522 RepID=UPI0021B78F77|nr:ROK family protein [Bacillus sp. Marseille-Q3570]